MTYNNLHKDQLDSATQIASYGKISHCRELLVKCFHKLECKIKVPDDISLFELVDINSRPDSFNISLKELFHFRTSNLPAVYDNSYSDCSSLGEENLELKMATTEQKRTFIGTCASILPENYDGNPLSLESFIDKIDLIQKLTDENLNVTFISFVKSTLESKGREALPQNINSIDEIKVALRSNIKPENSIVAGKIAALQIRNNDFTDFTKQAEDLEDALERSLVIEGITKARAR